MQDLIVLPCNELVFYGVGEHEAPLGSGGVHLEPKDFHDKLAHASDAVVVDVRNHYEADIGRFDGQVKKGGAKYIDPGMRRSTDFPSWLEKASTQKALAGKQVLMYCTGGIRCERASALLNQKLGSQVAGVFQLQGGIEKYLQEFPDGGFWKGKNYTFDKREAISAGEPAGVGGVLTKSQIKEQKTSAISRCCRCSAPWDRYTGKRKCFTCGVPVLLCVQCVDVKLSTGKGIGVGGGGNVETEADRMLQLSVRCPLCKKEVGIVCMSVSVCLSVCLCACLSVCLCLSLSQTHTRCTQNITVAAQDVDLTDNGKRAKFEGDGGVATGVQVAKAASSVVMWGGEHGKKKKEKRKQSDGSGRVSLKQSDGREGGSGGEGKKKAKRMCKFGAGCTRADCWFSHPGR